MRWLLLLAFFSLTGCEGPLKFFGRGTSVAANVQAGKENVQQLVAKQERTEAGRDVVQQTTPITAREIEEVNIQQTPVWMVVLLVLGWLLPSPNEIARWLRGLFRK